jgi:hypothetical protein
MPRVTEALTTEGGWTTPRAPTNLAQQDTYFAMLRFRPAHPHDAPFAVAVVTGSGHLEGTTREWNGLKSQLDSADAAAQAPRRRRWPTALAGVAATAHSSSQL